MMAFNILQNWDGVSVPVAETDGVSSASGFDYLLAL